MNSLLKTYNFKVYLFQENKLHRFASCFKKGAAKTITLGGTRATL